MRRLPPAYGASGSYLAALVASAARDSAAAAEYYRQALNADSSNVRLLDQAFIAELLDGNLQEAFRFAEKIIQREPASTLARVVLGVRSVKQREYVRARGHFQRASADLHQPDFGLALFRSFAMVGQGEKLAALKSLDRFSDADLRVFRDYFAGLLAGIGGLDSEAEARLQAAYRAENGLMRVVEAYARELARRGKVEEARQVIARWTSDNPNQPYLDPLAKALAAEEKVRLLAATPAEGLAEVFYILGALGQGQRDPVTAMIYLQLASYLAPAEEIYVLTQAEFQDQARQFARAAALYAAIPAESPFANRAAIGRATALDRLEKHEEAITVLGNLLASHPGDYEAADTLGALLRMKKRWAESVAVYDAVLKTIPRLESRHFVLLFGRAIGYERQKMWPQAEPDFLAALDLLPRKPRTQREAAERAQVMNYLAYSWVDNGINIERSFDMLREAVALTPGDGAVVDSLGWAYFRLGKYADAVRELERAVLLKSGDPTINDHLGDAYFRVGRAREAEFQMAAIARTQPRAGGCGENPRQARKGLRGRQRQGRLMPGAAVLVEFAPAKLNLSLHVLGRRADGYHRIESLVTFASVGDRLTLEPGAPLRLALFGPFAPGLAADETNLVLRAARAFAARVAGARLGAFTLEKNLPMAAGIGGGSADAAAALRLLAWHHGLSLDDPRLMDAARSLGADVPVCLAPALRLMRGIGHELGPKLAARKAPALLVNPNVAVPTGAVFAALGLRPGERRQDAGGERNDLAAAAIALEPVIGQVLACLEGQSGVTLARMSGSGATCFALFADDAARDAAQASINTCDAATPKSRTRSRWWCAPCDVLVLA